MLSKNKVKTFQIAFLFCVLLKASLHAQNDKSVHYKFNETDSSYSFYGSFLVKAKPDCILNICFNQEHIKELAAEAKNVELLKEGINWNIMRYTYQKLIYFESKSVWYRTIDKEKQRIEFKMLSSKNSHEIMPKMLFSSGYYQLKKVGEYTQVEYHQQCQLNKVSLTKFQILFVKKSAVKVMQRFKKYMNQYCGCTTQ